jgi:hypothetical protein
MHILEKNKTCCAGLDGLLANAGLRGLSVIVTRGARDFTFSLQSRGIDLRDHSKIVANPAAPDLFVNLSRSVVIQYCPFCGTKLARLARRYRSDYEMLVNNHKQYEDKVL